MKTDVLPEPTRRLLEKFLPDDLPPETYLAEGTAIALWIGHRQSVDLDWFTRREFDEQHRLADAPLEKANNPN